MMDVNENLEAQYEDFYQRKMKRLRKALQDGIVSEHEFLGARENLEEWYQSKLAHVEITRLLTQCLDVALEGQDVAEGERAAYEEILQRVSRGEDQTKVLAEIAPRLGLTPEYIISAARDNAGQGKTNH